MIAVAFVVGCGGGGGNAEPVEPKEPTEPTTTKSDPTAISNTGLDRPTKDDKAAAKVEPTEKVEPAATEPEPAADAVAFDVADAYVNTGVVECDEPFNKYIDCIMDKAPEQGKQAMVDGLAQAAEAWEQAAGTEEGRNALRESCVAVESAWQQGAQGLGCTW
jgi:hypothetical protein